MIRESTFSSVKLQTHTFPLTSSDTFSQDPSSLLFPTRANMVYLVQFTKTSTYMSFQHYHTMTFSHRLCRRIYTTTNFLSPFNVYMN